MLIVDGARGAALGGRYLIEGWLPKWGRTAPLLSRVELDRRLTWHRRVAARPDRAAALRLEEGSRYSQNGEDGIIGALVRRLGLETGFFVEIGASDGAENCTRALAEAGWRGVWLEGDSDRARDAADVATSLEVDVVQAMVTSENVDRLLRDAAVPEESEVFVLDIDGNDFWVLRAALERHRPLILVCEYNGAFPPGHFWTRRNRPQAAWDGSFRHGASLDALTWAAGRAGYALVACDSAGVNAFYVRRDRLDDDLRMMAGSPADHYRPMLTSRPLFGHPKRRQRPLGAISAAERPLLRLREGQLVDRPDAPPGTVVAAAIVENRTSKAISSAQPHPVHVSCHWLDDAGHVVEHEGERNVLPTEIASGSVQLVYGIFTRPDGGSVLQLRLVQEGVAWFEDGPDLAVA